MAARDFVTKTVEDVQLDAGSGTGMAARYLNLDRNGDMLMPGCFEGCLDAFLRDGTVKLEHWEPLPIGYPTAAKEVDLGLSVAWKYHDTAQAQDAYKVAKERQDAGKSVGLSVGFRIAKGGYIEFSDTDALIAYVRTTRWASMVDEDAVRNSGRTYCWAITKASELWEFSQVGTPGNPLAVADRIKSLFGGDGSLAGLEAAEHLDTVLAAVGGVTSRIQGIAEKRALDNRGLSSERMKQIDDLVSALQRLKSIGPVSRKVELAMLDADAFLAGIDA